MKMTKGPILVLVCGEKCCKVDFYWRVLRPLLRLSWFGNEVTIGDPAEQCNLGTNNECALFAAPGQNVTSKQK